MKVQMMLQCEVKGREYSFDVNHDLKVSSVVDCTSDDDLLLILENWIKVACEQSSVRDSFKFEKDFNLIIPKITSQISFCDLGNLPRWLYKVAESKFLDAEGKNVCLKVFVRFYLGA